MEEYHQRLSNVLGTDTQLRNIKPADLHSPRGLQPEALSTDHKTDASAFENERINLSEFYKLPECGLKPLIAERNTTLGKLQAPSQRYLYELRIRSTMTSCMAKAAPAQKDVLTALVKRKHPALLHSWRKLLLDSEEIKQALFHTSSSLSTGEKHDFAIQSWGQLRSYDPKNVEENDEMTYPELTHLQNLEAQLKTISESKIPAKLRHSMVTLNHYLPQTTDFLEKHTSALDCQKTQDKTKLQYLNNVFKLFFIEKIQPLSSQMNQWHYKLQPIMADLYRDQSIDPYQQIVTQHFQSYQNNIKRHVRLWQSLYKTCGFSPGQ